AFAATATGGDAHSWSRVLLAIFDQCRYGLKSPRSEPPKHQSASGQTRPIWQCFQTIAAIASLPLSGWKGCKMAIAFLSERNDCQMGSANRLLAALWRRRRTSRRRS
ncbi:hypothetical protein N9L68_06195, partial [bacterium]|nr:hypothetical protein [bacterium]